MSAYAAVENQKEAERCLNAYGGTLEKANKAEGYGLCIDKAMDRVDKRTVAYCENDLKGCKNVPATPMGVGEGAGETPKRIRPTDNSEATKEVANTSAADTTSQSTGNQATTTMSNSSADIQAAQDALNDVQSCCTNPSSCNIMGGVFGNVGSGDIGSQVSNLGNAYMAGGGDMSKASMIAACQQMNGLGNSGNTTNSSYAGTCYAKINTCTQLTDPLVSQYNNAGDSSTASTISRIGSNCTSYMSRYRELSAQGTQSASSANVGALCAQLMGQMAQPQSASAWPNFNDQTQAICPPGSTDAACMSCAQNPSGPGCTQAAKESASVGFKSKGEDDLSGDFNTPDLSAVPPAGVTGPEGNQPYEPAAAATIPGNSGGGIPGQGGSASNTPAAGRVGATLSDGYDTDRIHGFMGGGYSSQAAKMNTETKGSGGYSAGGDAGGAYAGMDLKKYLPGQQNDPNLKIAGLSSPSPDIGPKYGDIFKRITDRIQVLCRYNRLLDCETKH